MKRVIFVDDEPRVLDGLQRLLRPQRNEWEMSFAPSGEAALSLMEDTSYDVIVSDMRMPGMDGAALLDRVRERFPQMARIILSGYSDVDAVLRTVSVAHQYLTKPCDPDALREIIDRVCSLQALLADEALRRVVGQLGELPSSPRLYTALTRALENPETPLDRVTAIVEQDAAMCAKCLQLVNSAFFGLARRVTSVRQALSYLGTNMLRTLVFSVEVFRTFDSGKLRRFQLESLERHALLTAKIALQLLPDRRRAEDAFMASVLQDVGKLVLASRLPNDLERAIEAARTAQAPLHSMEARLLGVSHAEIGAYLLGLWGLPYAIVEAVAYHHAPERISHRSFDVPGAVYVANLLAREQLAQPVQADESRDDVEPAYLKAVGMIEELPRWRAIAADIAASVEM